jgi:GPH family glycoside/pentoside/hexuronide:cation symporter
MLIVFAYFLIYTFGVSLKNLGLVYYCNYVLGTYNDGITQMLVSVIGGVPMGIGIFAVWPLAKRFGKRNVTLWGFVLYALGSLICWIFPTNMVIVLIGQFIKNIGGLPCAYVFMALFADTLDHLEWKSGIRSDGIAMSIYNIIACAMIGIVTGIFNGLLANAGYIAPELDALGNTVAFTQPEAVTGVITFSFVGLEVFTGIALAILLAFFSVEKTIGRKQAIIKARQGVEATEPEISLTEKEELLWQKERAMGEEYYTKISAKINNV